MTNQEAMQYRFFFRFQSFRPTGRGLWLPVFAFFFFPWDGIAQKPLDTIFLRNPSFEGQARYEAMGWTDCSFPGETPYDIQPGEFQCTRPPHSGKSYVGMVVRDNDTYEAMSQRLSKPLKHGRCYAFSLMLARSESYVSISRKTGQTAHYVTPARVRIWGGNAPCDRREVLAESKVVINTKWKNYNFKLKPLRDYNYLIIEAFYKTPTLFSYNGNVLVDDATNIFEVTCEDDAIAVLDKVRHLDSQPVEPPVQPHRDAPPKASKPAKPTAPAAKPANKPKPKPEPENPVVDNTRPTPAEKVIMPELNEKVTSGQILRIRNLNFKADSAEIPASGKAVLDEVANFLKEHPTIRIEVGGHTNNRCDTPFCNKLSERRAKAVADALIRRGIDPARITYKGYGKTRPVATNTTREGRKKNQRVEIKILDE